MRPIQEIPVPALSAAEVSVSYRSAQGLLPVLEQVTLAVEEGEYLSLLGPSGCGKSTLLHILAGLKAPETGRVLVRGSALPRHPPVAYMQQKDLLLPWRTVWENILLGPELQGRGGGARETALAGDLLRRFRLHKFAQAYPSQLSGGMRQRTALIRTLLCEQPILLLDEPFSAVDAITRAQLQEMVLDVWRTFNKTIVHVTHDVDEAILLSTRIVLLAGQPGRILREIPISIPHRHRLKSPEFLRLKADILEGLRDELP